VTEITPQSSPSAMPEALSRLYHGRRWNYFKDCLIERFGGVVYKVGVDAGFDCPNRDGKKAWGGCAYCSQQGSLSPHQDPKLGILDQIEKGRAFVRRRYKAEKFIVYYQAFTNTYAPVSVLRERFEPALVDDSIVGLSVASRPDCISEDNIGYLAELAGRLPYFTVELGLQSVYQNRLAWVNRQESVEDYVRAMEMLNKAGVPVITHVILGFPGESRQDMEDTVKLANDMKTRGIKLQMLHVIKGTKLGVMYGREPFELMSMDEYLDTVIHMIERLSPDVEIHRITGETDSESLIAPDWTRQKAKFFESFDRELLARDTWQGRLV
jgi:radical SAM protein (TIGR01212 family)